MLHYLDCGKIVAQSFGYYENGFYESMQTMYLSTVKLIMDNPDISKSYTQKLESLRQQYKTVGWEFIE